MPFELLLLPLGFARKLRGRGYRSLLLSLMLFHVGIALTACGVHANPRSSSLTVVATASTGQQHQAALTVKAPAP